MSEHFDNLGHVPADEFLSDFYSPVEDSVVPLKETIIEPQGVAEFEPSSDVEGGLQQQPDMPTLWERMKSFTGRNKGKIALGSFALSTVLTFSSHSYNQVEHDLTEALPWVGGGVVASETAFVVGAGMMGAAVGSKIGNPLKVKERIPEIAEQANNSWLFKSGFWINTTGAVGTAAIISAGVIAKLPPESYGVLPVAFADMGLTATVRMAMHRGIRDNVQRRQTEHQEAE